MKYILLIYCTLYFCIVYFITMPNIHFCPKYLNINTFAKYISVCVLLIHIFCEYV